MDSNNTITTFTHINNNMASMSESVPSTTSDTDVTFHSLYDKWTMYAHLPHDTDWSIDSYKNILTISTMEEMIALIETLPDIMVKNCMLFLMKNEVKPIWEDAKNRNGGCFSFKVANKDVSFVWRNLCYMLGGETISENDTFMSNITGASISPKRNFCIIKIWMSNCDNQDVKVIKSIEGLNKQGVLFRKHKPLY
jgi:hypothetical protein